MIPELGHYALILAFCLALVQVVLPFYGVLKNNKNLMALSRRTAIGQCFFVALSFASLEIAFVTNDFSLPYVAQHSNSHLPLFYRFGAIWSAHEGSILLWIFILTIWSAAVAVASKKLPLAIVARVLIILSLLAIGFYLFLLTTSDPFIRVWSNIPIDGNDLNPLLQDPGLIYHPPILYMGYVGFSVAFAFAITALWCGQLDASWARWARPWTVMAWCFLTLGIVLGSWWAYRELGWGGWWFWDPVENASFLPWLIATALIHSLAATSKRNTFKAWTVLLAVMAFSLSLLGTFLVRSGVLISVHAFAVDPRRGTFILRFLSLVIGASLILYALRGKKLIEEKNALRSEDAVLLFNNMLLFVAMITVLLGTLYPLIIDILGLDKLSVGAPYFNTVFGVLMVPLLLSMGVGPLLYWHYHGFQFRRNRTEKNSTPQGVGILIKQSVYVLVVSLLIVMLLLYTEQLMLHWLVIVGLTLSFFILLNLTARPRLWKRRHIPMQLGHAGMAVMVIGIVLSSLYGQERDLRMKLKETVKVGPYHFQLINVAKLKGPNYHGAKALVAVRQHQQVINYLHPQWRIFNVEQIALSKIAIDAGMFRDLYVALGAPLSHNDWAMRIYYKPFVRWIWSGGLMMVLAGVLALLNHRRKKGREVY